MIGIGYDGSEGATAAPREATALAAEFEATLRPITAVPPLELGWSADAFYTPVDSGNTIRENRHEEFRRMLEEAADALPAEARAATVLVEGRPSTVIVIPRDASTPSADTSDAAAAAAA